jgi:predicted acyltransferase
LGIGCLAAGWVWGYEFPIIKHIWTSSMTLWAAGWSYLLLAFFYLVIDVLGFRKWAFFFVVIGMNAIAIYMATELFHFTIISNILIGNLAKQLGNFGKFLVPFGALMIEWLILLYMYRKKTFIRV